MGRKLKYHEQKLLKKTNLVQWRKENNIRIGDIMARFGLESSEEYHDYNRLVGKINSLTNFIRQMDPDDKVRISITKQFVDRLFNLGIINSPTLQECEKVTVSHVCRRRFSAVLVHLNFCQKISDADRYIRQGHVRIGPNVITNPAMLVSTDMEDYIGWAHGSKIQAHVQEYNETFDDFDNIE